MKPYYTRAISRSITLDTPYGGLINPAEGPIFEYLGVGNTGETPKPAYSYMVGHITDHATALHAFHGMNPQDATEFARHGLNETNIPQATRAHLYRQIHAQLGFTPDECKDSGEDTISAVTNKYTHEVLFYYFYIHGDGFAMVFQLD